MASEIDLCNLALSQLGQSRQITAISPPDGSSEAALCARFYPIARNTILESHYWGFATKRVTLADLGSPPDAWAYRYAWPNEALLIQALYVDTDDTEQEFAIESDSTGTVIYSNTDDAMVRYTALITDVNKYGGMVQQAITFMLSSFLAGPIIKGKAGMAVSEAMLNKSLGWQGKAILNDAMGQTEQVEAEPGYQSVRLQTPSIRARS